MSKVSSDSASSKQKLEMVIKRGNLIIDMMEKKGLDMKLHKEKMIDARTKFKNGNIEESYKIAIDCIMELKDMKDNTSDTQTPKEKNKTDRRGKGVYALIRDNSSEVEKKIKEWKVIIGGWRNKGYQFEADKSLYERSFDQIEKRFISIGEQIEKAEGIRGKISRIREDFSHVGKSYLKKVDEIERAVFRLDRLDDIERRLKTYKANISAVDERYRNLHTKMSRYRRKGLNTSALEEMLDNDEDLDYLDKQFSIYESNIDFLVKEKKKLLKLKENSFIENFEIEVIELEKMIDDPWLLDQIVERMLDLEKTLLKAKESDIRVEEERKRRGEIRKSLDKYRTEGFKVEVVEQLLDEDMNLLEEEYDIFIRQTARLRSLKEKLFKLDATGFEEEISVISLKLFDPGNIDEIEGELNKLKDNILNQRIRSKKIENHIKEWSGMGFKISKLETALISDIELAENIHNEYEVSITELTDYEARLRDINQRNIQDLVRKVNLKIKNPELIESVRKEMKVILTKVSEIDVIREKRKELNNLLKTWKSQGYNIDKILEDTRNETSMDGLEKIILDKTRAIAALESFKNEFPAFERGWFPEIEDEIKKNMNNPENSKETLKNFTKLKDLIKKEEKKRGEISRKLNELANRGIDVKRVVDRLPGNSTELNDEYAIFKEKIKRLLILKTKLLKIAHKNGDQEIEMFAKALNDPYEVEKYEEQVKNRSSSHLSAKKDKKAFTEEEIGNMKKEAKDLFKQEKLDESLEIFNKILEASPDDKESVFYKKKVQGRMRSQADEKKITENDDDDDIPAEPVSSGNEIRKATATDFKGDTNCLSCKGSGKCVWCDGTGNCSTCNGTGKTFGEPCPTCKGSGECSVCKGKGSCSWCST